MFFCLGCSTEDLWDELQTSAEVEDSSQFLSCTTPKSGSTRNLSNTATLSSSGSTMSYGYRHYVVWIDEVSGAGDVYMRRSEDDGRTFRASQRISSGADRAYSPAVAAAGTYVHVTWLEGGKVKTRSSSNYGVSFGPTRVVASVANGLSVAISASQNHVYLLWGHSTGSQSAAIRFSASHDNGMTFSESLGLSPLNNVGSFHIASHGSYVFAVWDSGLEDSSQVYFRRSVNNGTSFGSVRNLIDDQDLRGYVVKPVVAGNSLFIGWNESNAALPGQPQSIVIRRSSDNGATFLSKKNVFSAGPPDPGPFGLAFDARGTQVTVGFKVLSPDSMQVELYTQHSDDSATTFTEPQHLATLEDIPSFFQVFQGTQYRHVLWEQDDLFGNSDIVYTYSKDGGAMFAPPTNLSNSTRATHPKASIHNDAALSIIWQDTTTGSSEINVKLIRPCH